jgi:hypothetical protein
VQDNDFEGGFFGVFAGFVITHSASLHRFLYNFWVSIPASLCHSSQKAHSSLLHSKAECAFHTVYF